MENGNKNTVLSDDQLKDVSGGVMINVIMTSCSNKTQTECKRLPDCVWKDNKCVRRG